MTRPPHPPLSGRWLAIVFFLLAAGIGTLWHSALSAYEAAVLRERGRELQAIAELKIAFVRFWLDGRRGDAALQAGRPLMASMLARGRPGIDRTQRTLQAEFEKIGAAYGYEAVLLVDRQGRPRLRAGAAAPVFDERAALDAMAQRTTVVSRAYRPAGENRSRLDIVAPVFDRGRPQAPVVGALVFVLDPRAHLDALLRLWPAPSASGETFLVESGGEQIVYLSSLRHAEAATLQRRVDERELPAAQAARGLEGLVDGRDYRGVPVLAAVGRVPDMPWFIVAKLDRDEILAPVRREAIWSGALFALLALALGLALLAWHRQGRSELALARQAAAAEAMRTSEARFRKLHAHGWVSSLLFDRDMNVVYASRGDDELLGRAALGQSIAAGTALVHPDDLPKVQAAHRSALAQPGVTQVVEHRLRRPDGGWLVVEGRFTNEFDDPDIGALVYQARDITALREAEAQRLEYACRQRDALVREVHHRIKNHLQGLAGLLRQRLSGTARPVLEEVVAQINAISVVHGLQGRTASGRISLRGVLTEIAAFLGGVHGLPIRLEDDAQQCFRAQPCSGETVCRWFVPEEEAVPLALIVNELLTNAVRHQREAAPLVLHLVCDDAGARLLWRNRGRLPAGLDFAAGRGLGTGLGLVRSLMPPQGLTIALDQVADDGVETRLELGPPILQPEAGTSHPA